MLKCESRDPSSYSKQLNDRGLFDELVHIHEHSIDVANVFLGNGA